MIVWKSQDVTLKSFPLIPDVFQALRNSVRNGRATSILRLFVSESQMTLLDKQSSVTTSRCALAFVVTDKEPDNLWP